MSINMSLSSQAQHINIFYFYEGVRDIGGAGLGFSNYKSLRCEIGLTFPVKTCPRHWDSRYQAQSSVSS